MVNSMSAQSLPFVGRRHGSICHPPSGLSCLTMLSVRYKWRTRSSFGVVECLLKYNPPPPFFLGHGPVIDDPRPFSGHSLSEVT
jgi:hypothetical protein